MPSSPRSPGNSSNFCAPQARAADALYILGDLFESWVGDDAPDPAQTRGH